MARHRITNQNKNKILTSVEKNQNAAPKTTTGCNMAQHSRRYKYQKIKPKFNRRLYFGFRVRWGYVDKALKIKIRF